VKILVVEDEERIATFLVKGLSREGYGLEHVKTGATPSSAPAGPTW